MVSTTIPHFFSASPHGFPGSKAANCSAIGPTTLYGKVNMAEHAP